MGDEQNRRIARYKKKDFPELREVSDKCADRILDSVADEQKSVVARLGWVIILGALPASALAGIAVSIVSKWIPLDERSRHVFSGVGTLFFVAVPCGLLAWKMYRDARNRVRTEVAHRCPACGYDLTGNTSGVCPECGRAIEPAADAPGATPSPDGEAVRADRQ